MTNIQYNAIQQQNTTTPASKLEHSLKSPTLCQKLNIMFAKIVFNGGLLSWIVVQINTQYRIPHPFNWPRTVWWLHWSRWELSIAWKSFLHRAYSAETPSALSQALQRQKTQNVIMHFDINKYSYIHCNRSFGNNWTDHW